MDSDTYLIAGFYADGYVNATIVDGWGRGCFTFILSGLVESMDDPVKQGQKRFLLSHGWLLMCGHVMSSEEYLRLVELVKPCYIVTAVGLIIPKVGSLTYPPLPT